MICVGGFYFCGIELVRVVGLDFELLIFEDVFFYGCVVWWVGVDGFFWCCI